MSKLVERRQERINAKKMSKDEVVNLDSKGLEDVTIFAFGGKDDEEAVWCCTDGMENHDLMEISMWLPSKKYMPVCFDLLRYLCIVMSRGAVYRANRRHVIDDYEGGPVCHVFDLVYSDVDTLEVEYCWYDLIRYAGDIWIFDHNQLKWVER